VPPAKKRKESIRIIIPPVPPQLDAEFGAGPLESRRVQIGEALRASGLDEQATASVLAGVVRTLTEKTNETGNVDRLLVDVVKEVFRHLASPERSGPGDSSVFVQMIHNVPRPERPRRQLSQAPAAELDAHPELPIVDVALSPD